MKKLIILALLVSTCHSCASFSKRYFKSYYKSVEQVADICGTYELYPIRTYTEYGIKKVEQSNQDPNNAYDKIANKQFGLTRDSLNQLVKEVIDKAQVRISNPHPDSIYLELLVNDLVQRDTTFAVELKGGFVELDNKYKEWVGLPYLWGRYSIQKVRIGLLENDNLLIDEVRESAGGRLLILSNGHRHRRAYEFSRLRLR